jgi:ElaB/YqjD/DUF883 family membrane-anchored ribosome-binding protein
VEQLLEMSELSAPSGVVDHNRTINASRRMIMAQVPSASKGDVERMADDVADSLAHAASTDSGATSSDVQAELENLRRDIAALTQTIASFGSGKIREAGETSQQYIDSARDTLLTVEEDVEAYVRAKPFQSLAMAAGVGYLLVLISRR